MKNKLFLITFAFICLVANHNSHAMIRTVQSLGVCQKLKDISPVKKAVAAGAAIAGLAGAVYYFKNLAQKPVTNPDLGKKTVTPRSFEAKTPTELVREEITKMLNSLNPEKQQHARRLLALLSEDGITIDLKKEFKEFSSETPIIDYGLWNQDGGLLTVVQSTASSNLPPTTQEFSYFIFGTKKKTSSHFLSKDKNPIKKNIPMDQHYGFSTVCGTLTVEKISESSLRIKLKNITTHPNFRKKHYAQ